MTNVPQRELRNNISDVLRRAERGERMTITVNGRPVAELGPLPQPRDLAAAAQLAEILADTPVDAGWERELEQLRAEERQAAREPWAE